MDFADNKLTSFTKKIIDLIDQPNMQPNELKAYFDSSPEEVRQAHNSLCDALTTATTAATAAANLGFQTTAGVPADNVQDAIENVQDQLDAAVMGNIPSGSVTNDKLAQDVRDHFTTIENSVTTEASTRASGDSSLQGQINTLNGRMSTAETAIARKCEIQLGSYEGTGEYNTQTIVLGYQPLAVLVSGGRALYGDGTEHPHDVVMPGLDGVFTSVTATGFTVTGWLNLSSWTPAYRYIAFKPV